MTAMRALLVLAAAIGCGGRAIPVPAPAPGAPAPAAPEVAAGDAPVAPALPVPRFQLAPISEDSIVADIAWLVAPERRGRSAADARDVARWLENELAAAGYAPIVQPIEKLGVQVNVIAVHAPADARETVVVIAHYDHLGSGYPGADDNASGVAVALAVARELAASGGVAGRVVFLFTGGEEIGLHGALAYVAAPTHPLADTRFAINLDMVGRRLFESAIDKDAALGAVGADGALGVAAQEAAAAVGIELVTVTPRMVKLIGQDYRSDDWVFRDRGVPAVHLSTGLHDDYHQPTDTLDKLSRPQLVRNARFLRELLVRVAR
jgi:hypothetical protein